MIPKPTEQAERKEPPSLGSGGPSLTAVEVIPAKKSLPLVFEQQPKESAKAFEAFSTYLRLGANRSLEAVGQKLGKSRKLMERWASKYDWVIRVKAHAAHLAELERVAIEAVATEKAVEWERTHEPVRRAMWKKAEQLLAAVDRFLEQWNKSNRPPGFESIVRGIELAFRLKQLAAGMPTEVKEVNNTFSGKLEVEWEIALRKAYGAATPADTAAPAVVDVEEVTGVTKDVSGAKDQVSGGEAKEGK